MARPVALLALLLFHAALCGEPDSESPIAPDAGGLPAGEEAVAPTPEPSSPIAAAEKAAARHSVADADAAQAWLRLKSLMDSHSAETPAELLNEASLLRTGGDGRRKRPGRALPLLEAVAAAANHSAVPRDNSTAAELELGHMHLRGEGVAQDVARAAAHYLRAADEGEPEAQTALGVLYSSGFGLPHDPALAATYPVSYTHLTLPTICSV